MVFGSLVLVSHEAHLYFLTLRLFRYPLYWTYMVFVYPAPLPLFRGTTLHPPHTCDPTCDHMTLLFYSR